MPTGVYKRTKEHKIKMGGKNNNLYKDGRTLRKVYCMDCGKELKDYRSKRCRSCSKNGKRNSKYTDGRSSNKSYCIDCGEEIYWRSKRCLSCRSKENWQKGAYDGVFKSPTKPEKEIIRILEDLKIDYIFQYRPEGYSKPYDFYIPGLNLLIEYDSKYWHNRLGVKERDAEKSKYAKDNGYNLLRLNKMLQEMRK